jgi:N-acetyl-gamma-glutamyl-phosphate reductase
MHRMNPTVFIDGDQGTTGLDLQNRLRGRDEFRVLTLPAQLRKDPQARRAALNRCDIAVLCLPDAAAREAVAMIDNPEVRVIDASSAHRVTPGWTYGLPELSTTQAQQIAASRRVSNPGCYPTGAVALLRPLVDAGLLPAGQPLNIHAVSGYSGKGRAGVEQFEVQGVAVPGFQAYGLGLEHKHVPEIQQYARLATRPVFLPSYGSFRQGILLTIPLHAAWLAPGTTGARLHECLAAHYAGSRYVRVTPLRAPADMGELDPQVLNGTNFMELTVAANDRTGQAVLCAVLDNLGKGAAGAAVQNLELMAAAAAAAVREPALPR